MHYHVGMTYKDKYLILNSIYKYMFPQFYIFSSSNVESFIFPFFLDSHIT